MKALIIDTVATGRPKFDRPVAEQPYIVQLAAILFDGPNIRHQFSYTICPLTPEEEYVEVPAEVAALHGITTEIAHKFGVTISTAFGSLQRLLDHADCIVGHNILFDITIIKTELSRCHQWYPILAGISAVPRICTMKTHGEPIKLAKLHQLLLPSAPALKTHTAHDDALTCAEIFQEYLRRQIPLIDVNPKTNCK